MRDGTWGDAMNIWDDNWQEYQQRAANHFHGVFVVCVGAALRNKRISLTDYADEIGMVHSRIRRLMTGTLDVTLRDVCDVALGIGFELNPNPVQIRFDPIMTAADIGIEEE